MWQLKGLMRGWWELKKRLLEIFPDITKDKSESEHVRQQLESALQAAWDTIDNKSFDVLYQSMPDRIAACIKTGGWHTKYQQERVRIFCTLFCTYCTLSSSGQIHQL
jgi:hypothetical protein